jgi:hypothetical protein
MKANCNFYPVRSFIPSGPQREVSTQVLDTGIVQSKTSLMKSNLGYCTSTPTFVWYMGINPLVRLVYKQSGLASGPPQASLPCRSREKHLLQRMPLILNGFDRRLGLSHKHMSLVYRIGQPGHLETSKVSCI